MMNDVSPGLLPYQRYPAKVLIPLMLDSDTESLLRLARWLSQWEPVLMVGIVPIPEGQNLSAGATAAHQLRRLIQENVDRVNLRAKARIRVSYSPWEEVKAVLRDEPTIELLVLNWPQQLKVLRLSAAEILSHPPRDVIVVRGPFPEKPASILVPMRGGPHAERALRLALELSRSTGARVTALHLLEPDQEQQDEDTFAGMAQVLAELPEVRQQTITTENQSAVILENSRDFDVVILGTAAHPTKSTFSFGLTMDVMLEQAPSAVIGAKTRRVVFPAEGSRFGARAISVLVDQWFAENSFQADEFADLARLVAVKEERGITISLALPALNEEKTIGPIIQASQQALMETAPLLDEIVLIDSNSSDRTREIAADLGIPVYIHQEILPEHGARQGKGEALWKSLYVTKGDIIIWVDTDVSNFHPHFVYGLIGPFLQRPNLMFVKGFYHRPLRTGAGLEPGRGGRVTELTARPLINLFYPGLSGIIQPLAGEYGGRREALEQAVFTSGYGVETSLLIEIYEKFKLAAIAQVDLLERIHRNQSLTELSKMSFAIIQTVIGKLESRSGQAMLQDVNRTMKTVQHEAGQYYLDVEEIAELERPPMIQIPAYRRKRGLPELAEE
ncbi:MAG: glucosyl-3-phosphoglycerate synthase [Chloroflexi bacterium]|nr:glucosyl-3-phosphoglycerate synthase [Chloroflexota bacterium]MCI0580445.1 glucosyl-3-phosphoglycerate synthase [Chloroflexota bacterium]MCI0649189.1 glucosyl-3-phosphoglycerate synthase [Chloroflexota bacterium]MCI0727999.1 glucosyl-3-phosphoglycerate synthase [Chloroflexota bacterium]